MTDPATQWEQDARRPDQSAQTRLRLAAMAGHMRQDKIAARYPSLARPFPQPYEAVSWELVAALRQLSVPEKNKRAFAAADFALRQKRLLLAEEHPDWSAAKVDVEAQRLVYGVALEE